MQFFFLESPNLYIVNTFRDVDFLFQMFISLTFEHKLQCIFFVNMKLHVQIDVVDNR
jgi:hypothetical protein